MGKKRIITTEGVEGTVVADNAARASSKTPKKKIIAGTLHVEATFNNTKVVFSDKQGNALFWSSAGSLGFKGAKKVHLLLLRRSEMSSGKKLKLLVSKNQMSLLSVSVRVANQLFVHLWHMVSRLQRSKMLLQFRTTVQSLKSHVAYS